MKQIGLLMACGVLTLAFGCENRATGPRDSGGIVLTDSGIVLMDSGSDPDGGTPMTDSGTPPPRECEMNLPGPFPAELVPRCSAETRTCMGACTDATCINNCIMADATPPQDVMGTAVNCASCLSYSQAYCIEQNGGADLWHALQCCAQDRGCTTQACVQSMCAAEFNAVFSATNPAAGACLSSAPTMGEYAICFPAG